VEKRALKLSTEFTGQKLRIVQLKHWAILFVIYSKSKIVSYSITSVGVGHGADPGFLTVSPQVTLVITHKPGGRLLLLSTRPAFTFPGKEITPLAGTTLYCLVTEIHRCKWLAQFHYAMASSQDSNPRPVNGKTDALSIAKTHQPLYRAAQNFTLGSDTNQNTNRQR